MAVKHRFEGHFSLAASVKYFLISMAKVFLFSKLLQQPTHLQVFFSWDVVSKTIVPVMPKFYWNKPLQNYQGINKRSEEDCPLFGL